MSERADAVVIGAGIAGACVGWHLQEEGLENVVIVERDVVAGGTTAAGAGFLGLWAHAYLPGWGDEELEVEAYGLDFYRRLAERYEFDYRNNGNLWIATDEAAYEAYPGAIFAGGRDPDKRELSGAEVAEISGGLLNGEALHGGVLFPTGAQVTASRATAAVVADFLARGGTIHTRRPVESIVVDAGRAAGVETAAGRIDAGAVVLAAGAWSNHLLRPLGTSAPHVPLTLTRLITEPQDDVSSTLPGTFMPECHGLWMREHRGGLLWGCAYQNRVRYMHTDEVPDRFDSIPLDALFEILEAGKEAEPVIPALAREVGIQLAQGLPCYTADSHALAGRVPGVDGLYLIGGDNESGVGHGPGHARVLAEALAADRDTAVELFRLDRFGAATEADWIIAQMEGQDSTYFI